MGSKTPRVKQVDLHPTGEQFIEGSNWARRKRQKMRNSHFNAVDRFLVRNAGRPWSKVYAELCASADSRSLLGIEIRHHIECSVATKCWLDGLKVMTHDWRECVQEAHGLYVHPRSGLLRRNSDVRPAN